MASKSAFLTETSEIDIVPDSECSTPTFTVSPEAVSVEAVSVEAIALLPVAGASDVALFAVPPSAAQPLSMAAAPRTQVVAAKRSVGAGVKRERKRKDFCIREEKLSCGEIFAVRMSSRCDARFRLEQIALDCRRRVFRGYCARVKDSVSTARSALEKSPISWRFGLNFEGEPHRETPAKRGGVSMFTTVKRSCNKRAVEFCPTC